MNQYYPFGKQIIPTQEQVEAQQLKFKKYDYYGIPYGYFDTSKEGEGNTSKKERDRENARLLIMSGKSIPKDLETRLLQYKQQELVEKNR